MFGVTAEQVLEAYPYLELEDMLAALSFAAEAMQERELPLAAGSEQSGRPHPSDHVWHGRVEPNWPP